MEVLLQQYQLIREARSALLDYCETFLPGHFNEAIPAFANKSICELLVHVINVYRFWIGHFAVTSNEPLVKPEMVRNVQEVRNQFLLIDTLMNRFFELHGLKSSINAKVPGRDLHLTLTPLKLVTHVMTHEFHHKGQVLSMSRILGYTPVDTDVIRF